MSRTLIALGLIFIFLGLTAPLIQKMQLGQLPGDLFIKKGSFSFYFPLTTCLLLSLLLSFVLWIFHK